jgi:hypothetical protein
MERNAETMIQPPGLDRVLAHPWRAIAVAAVAGGVLALAPALAGAQTSPPLLGALPIVQRAANPAALLPQAPTALPGVSTAGRPATQAPAQAGLPALPAVPSTPARPGTPTAGLLPALPSGPAAGLLPAATPAVPTVASPSLPQVPGVAGTPKLAKPTTSLLPTGGVPALPTGGAPALPTTGVLPALPALPQSPSSPAGGGQPQVRDALPVAEGVEMPLLDVGVPAGLPQVPLLPGATIHSSPVPSLLQ